MAYPNAKMSHFCRRVNEPKVLKYLIGMGKLFSIFKIRFVNELSIQVDVWQVRDR